MVVFIGAAK